MTHLDDLKLDIKEAEWIYFNLINFYRSHHPPLRGAKHLVKLCQNSPHATRVNQGVLVGSGQSHVLLRVEKASVRDHFSDLEPCIIGDVAHSYHSAYLPLHRIAEGGKLYRTGDVVVAKQQNT